MSKTDSLFAVFAVLVAGYWLESRFNRLEALGKQLLRLSHLVRQEMAELAGKEDRVDRLRKEYAEDLALLARLETRQGLLGWALLGIVGALALAWWFFTAAR